VVLQCCQILNLQISIQPHCIDTIQQNVIFNQTDIETIKENITNLQFINAVYNNRIIILENENDKLKQIIKQLVNIDY